jgi:hypothetical protein
MLKKLATIASFPAFMLAARLIPWECLPGICVFYRMTGLPCPTCGMTRAVEALTRPDFARAWNLNSLAPGVVAVLGLWWAIAVYQSLTGRRTRMAAWAGRRMNLLIFLAVLILLAFGSLRIFLILSHA